MIRSLCLTAVTLSTTSLLAHPGHGPHGPLEGPLHSLSGLEYVAAATVVGAIAFMVLKLRSKRGAQTFKSRRD